ncbi:hypothetical protein GGR56DRAFT_21703 [Xylariaceae sp. FL0804]|nr:hypothetical protein GGR56DRAFT_21703 [Xylariaceae sp. FL0804]
MLRPQAGPGPQMSNTSGSAQDQVQEVLSNLYGTNIPPKATGAVATTLADDIDRYDSSLVQEPIWSSAAGAIVSAALTAFGPSGYYGALTAGGFAQPDFTSADWYKTGVPKSFQAVWASVDSEIHDIQTSVLDAAAQPTSTGSSAATTTTDSGSVASTSTNTGAAAPARATAQALGGLAAGIAMAAVAGL